jgi:predicted alpha/beta-fold hydrolase
MGRKMVSLFILLSSLTPMASPAKEVKSEQRIVHWYEGLIFKDPSFLFEFIRTLGYTTSQAADIGECFATARSIKDGDIYSWKKEWLATAHRIYTLAAQFENRGNLLSAKEAYFRASNYFRTAGFYLNAEKDRDDSISIWQKSVDSFQKGMAFDRSISSVQIPYEKTTLPGYLIKSEIKNAPLLIIQTGFDGTKEELYFEAGKAAYERGYNVLLFEGPGQGEAIKKQNLAFRYDWEKVITPVVDYAMSLDFIDKKKVALLGISLGGYLAARAAAFEHRLAACILNGGIFDFSENLYNSMPPQVIELLQENPAQFNPIIEGEMARNVNVYWFFQNGMWTLQAATPADVMRTITQYTLKGVVQKIKCPTLVIDSEDDRFLKGQPQKVYDQLNSPKTLLKFSPETTAQAHCQMGANAISNESIYSWLDETLSWKKP